MILTRTPLRISLFGGGTDYPIWFKEHGGAVLGLAIDHYVYVGVKHMPPGQEHTPGTLLRYRVQYSKVDDCQELEQIKHPAVKAALTYYGLDDVGALEFHIFSDLPGRAGLGGSGACTVGLCHALSALFPRATGGFIDPWSLADDAIYIEQEVIKEAVGCQDQVFAAHGGLNLIWFCKDEQRKLLPLVLPQERVEQLCAALLLVYSGNMRDAHVMAAKQIAVLHDRHRVMCAMREQALEGYELLLDTTQDINKIGVMLDEAWTLKKQITPEITSSSIDDLYTIGRQHGASGGKLLGAGGGGFMLFFSPLERRQELRNALTSRGIEWRSVRPSKNGTQILISED